MARASAHKNARKEPSQDRARATVDALLDATARVLVADGYDKASTNRIAARAGVSVGSLYQYFEGKDQLVAAVAQRHHEQMFEVLALAASDIAGRPLLAIVEGIVGAMLEAHAVDPALHRVLSEQIPRSMLASHIEEKVAAFVLALLEGNRALLRGDVDVDAAAFILVHAVEGVTHAATIERPGGLKDTRLRKELTRMVVAYLA